MARKPKKKRGNAKPSVRMDRGHLLRNVQMLYGQGRFDDAEQLIGSGLPNLNADAEALRIRGMIAERRNRPQDALSYANASLAIEAHSETHLLLAQIHSRHGDTAAAADSARTALEVDPENIRARLMLAATLEERNDVTEARSVLTPLTEHDELPADIARRVARLRAQLLLREEQYDDAIRELDTYCISNDAPAPERRGALYLRVKALDRSGQYQDAFATALRANAIGQQHFDPDARDRAIETLIETWNPNTLAAFPIGNEVTTEPVFIVGMPRSGTSLVDRIIDAHPNGLGVGELALLENFWAKINTDVDMALPPEQRYGRTTSEETALVTKHYLDALQCDPDYTPETTRVVNKSLDNVLMLGMLSKLFPKCRIIHVRRDLRDVAVSCFFGNFNTATMPWTTRLEWIARSQKIFNTLMAHWQQVLDVPIHTVEYEQLVTTPDQEVPRLIEYLGLEWDSQCMRFYETQRPIRTLSYEQVNAPITTASVGRHRNFESQLSAIEWPTESDQRS